MDLDTQNRMTSADSHSKEETTIAVVMLIIMANIIFPPLLVVTVPFFVWIIVDKIQLFIEKKKGEEL